MVVTIKGSCTVRPIEATCAGRLSLSELDQIDNTAHVPLIYFYKPQENWLSQEFLISNTLKDSLSKVLVPFYPLAGRLQWIGNGRLELECNDMGVPFIEAESQLTLDELGDFIAPNPKFNHLIPTVDYGLPIHELPIVLVQLTKFKRGGISIAVHISHAVVDGSSAMHFMSEWARFSRGEPLHTVPFLDRKVLRAGEPPLATAPPFVDASDLDDLPLLLGQNDSTEERKKETALMTLKVTKTQVDKLKKMANESWDKPNGREYTRYESLTSHIWRSTCKARGHKAEQRTALSIVTDIRGRMKPPLPKGYFGNATVPRIATSSAGELVSKPLGNVASKIRKEIEKVTDEYVRSAIEFFKNEDLTKFQDLHTLRSDEPIFFGNPNLCVVSWLTFPVCGFDFGWGKEIYNGRGYNDYDGECYILPSHEEDGSLSVTLCLQVDHMETFKKHFYADIINVYGASRL